MNKQSINEICVTILVCVTLLLIGLIWVVETPYEIKFSMEMDNNSLEAINSIDWKELAYNDGERISYTQEVDEIIIDCSKETYWVYPTTNPFTVKCNKTIMIGLEDKK